MMAWSTMRGVLAALWGCTALLAASQSLAAERCAAAERAAADRALALTDAEKAQSLAAIFPWGAPSSWRATDNERLLVQRHYALTYDDDLFGPVWSAEVLGLRPLPGGRVDCFRSDPRLPTPVSATPADYDEPIFDQGHMTPNGDMTFERTAIINTFLMSNMSPQFCQFNRGVWQILETFVRRWGRGPTPVYVLSGAVFDRDGDGARDPDAAAVRMKSRTGRARVAVPSMYFKVLGRPRPDGGLDTLTILLPHTQADLDGEAARQYLDDHVSNLPAVEALTGLKFFPQFTGPRTDVGHLWDVSGLSYRSLVAPPCRKTSGAAVVAGAPAVYGLP